MFSLDYRVDVSGGHTIRSLYGGVVGLQVRIYKFYSHFFPIGAKGFDEQHMQTNTKQAINNWRQGK